MSLARSHTPAWKSEQGSIGSEAGASGANGGLGTTMDRRGFLKRSGITVGGVPAAAAPVAAGAAAGAMCTHCSVECGIYAEVENGVWT